MTVEAAPLGDSSDAYISLAEADDYALRIVDTSVWSAATEAQKGAALVQATDDLDNVAWQGRKYDSTQDRAFPRIHGELPADGGLTSGSTWDWDEDANEAVVPDNVKQACFHQAVSIIEGARADRLNDQHDGVGSHAAGGMSESYIGKAPALCRKAHRLVRRYYRRTARIV